MYISENKLNDDKTGVVKYMSLLQKSKDLTMFKTLLEEINEYCEVNESLYEAYIKNDSKDNSKLILSAAREL